MATYKPIVLTNIGKSLGAEGSKLLKMLAKEGFDILSASQAEKMFEMIKETTPDIILFNPNKSRMDGYVFLSRFKRNRQFASIPVVFISLKASGSEVAKGFKAGVADYITRPFRQVEILARLRIRVSQYLGYRDPGSALRDLNVMLDYLPALLIQVDQEGRIDEYRAPEVPLSFMMQSDDRPGNVIDLLPEVPASLLMDAIAEADETGGRAMVTCPFQSDSGVEWIEMSVITQSSQSSDDHFTVLIQDITERKQIEKEKMNLEDTIRHEEKMESVSRLAGGISHDMNNILAVVMGLSSGLRMDSDQSESNLEDINQITIACRLGIELTSRLSSVGSEMSFNKEKLSLNNMVEEAGELLCRAISEHIVIETALDPDCADFIGDPVIMNHVLVNLALNAADAMPVGGTMTFYTRNYVPELEEFTETPSLVQGRYVLLQVSDTGDGMSPTVLKRAFEPFFSTKSTGKGAGLGLSMVYGMVKGLGGGISIDSDVGKGTVVTVLLPASISEGDLEAEEDKIKSVPPITHKCLLVDDNEMVLFAQKRLLKKLGYSVISAQNGQEALKIYQEQGDDISFVILDLVMPIMDGAETFKGLKEIDPDVRVLLCTGYPHQNIVSELIEQGALGILRKPFELDQLSDKLDQTFK